MNNDKLRDIYHNNYPWGMSYAMRINFEYGYFLEEGRLVAKYLQEPGDVLIIGSGNGREARPICRCGHRIVCIDNKFLYLQAGQNLFAREGVQDVHFISADMGQLPFRSESFDFVFFSLYSYSRKYGFDAIHDVHRILRSSGRLLLTAFTPLYKKSPFMDGAIRVGSEEQLRQEMSACNFELIESAVDPVRPEYRVAMLRLL